MFGLIFLIIVIIFHLFIALLVFFDNPKNKINQYFSLMIIFGTIWFLTNYLENENLSFDYRKLFLKLDFYSAILMVAFFYLFCLTFPKPRIVSSKKEGAIYFSIFSLAILSFTDFIINNIRIEDTTIVFDRGVGYWIYLLVIIFYICDGLKNLFQKYKKSIGIEKTQIFYVFLGIFISAIFAAPINLILPQIIFVPLNIARVGIYSFLAFSIFSTYAILRHHLFKIRVILTEILVGTIASILLFQALVTESLLWKILGFFLLSFFGVFGYFLVKSVIKEIELRAELERAYQELERIDTAKTEFLSMASHQLRTPLGIIKGYISMMLEGDYGEIPEKLKEKLKNTYVSNDRLVKLVNDLLDITRLEMGKIELSLERASIGEIISGVVEEMKVAAENKGLYLKWEKPKVALPEMSLDKNKIRQVILNLVDNAIKYTEKGGVTIKFKILDTKYQIQVIDTGVGMEKEEMENLFEIMARGRAGLQYWMQGTGLGLYTARKFVEMHGGRVWAESAGKNKGSTFYIELPIK